MAAQNGVTIWRRAHPLIVSQFPPAQMTVSVSNVLFYELTATYAVCIKLYSVMSFLVRLEDEVNLWWELRLGGVWEIVFILKRRGTGFYYVLKVDNNLAEFF